MARQDTIRLVGPPLTNKIMGAELSRLGRRAIEGFRRPKEIKRGNGTILVPFDLKLATLAANYHRTSSRVLWDLYVSKASRLEPLYDEFLADCVADDRSWLWDGMSISIRERNLHEFEAGYRQVVGAVKNAIVDGAAKRGIRIEVDGERPDLLLALRMHDQEVSVSIDLVGHAMHKRGYRLKGGVAPLRENIAAIMLMLARWDPRHEAVFDPLCGSGTIAIEAALASRGQPLWVGKRVAYHQIPAFEDAPIWDEPLFADANPSVSALDVDTKQIKRSADHLRRANVYDRVKLTRGDFRNINAAEYTGSQTGVIVTNPPYDERLESDERFYRELGDWSWEQKGFRFACLVAHPEFENAFGRRPRIKKPLSNAAIRSTFYVFDAPGDE